jgi:transposase InsO family protein
MALNAEMLVDVWREAQTVGHGKKQALLKRACERFGVSMATLYREFENIGLQVGRKRRADAGNITLSRDEAVVLSGYLMQAYRNNNKKIGGIEAALMELRANDVIRADRIDENTGEVTLLSTNTCARALRQYGLHPDQLRRPTPATELRSEHPNHVWQIDASISVLYYVPEGGLEDMNPAVFYKNKPGNFEKIKRQRLTRYVVTDHTSGAVFVWYVAGGESLANLAESLLEAMRERQGCALYGVPSILYFDPGSAATKTFLRFLTAMGIEYRIHAVQNSRATGQVENAQNIVETSFERGFKYCDVPTIDWINEQGQRWNRWYNATKAHSRHGMTRLNAWMKITQQQLRIVDIDAARALLTREPKPCRVNDFLTVQFEKTVYDVSQVPGVRIREKLDLTVNPLEQGRAWVVLYQDSKEVLYPVIAVQVDDYGFRADAPVIGESFAAPADTQLDTNRKEIQRLIYEVDTDDEAAAAAKAKKLPFGGRIDPYKHLDDLPEVSVLPRRGTAHSVGGVARIADRTLTIIEAATLLKQHIHWTPKHYASISARYPDGVPESHIEQLVAEYTGEQKTGGNAC